MNPMRLGLVTAIALLMAASAAAQLPSEPTLGVAPAKARALTVVPNAQAIERTIWVPHLDEGWVPQGVTFAEGSLIVSAYRAKTAERAGSCQLARIDPASGKETGLYEIPATCGHAGGLAYLGKNRLLVADTFMLFEIDLALAFKGQADKPDAAAIKRKIALAGELRGSYITSLKGVPWIGVYNRAGDSRIYAMAPEKLTAVRLNDNDADAAMILPQKAQGAAFDRDGQLWVSASSGTFGKLYRIDAKDGRVTAVFDMPAGIEDLTFDAEGKLWAVSEAGSAPYAFWSTYCPVLFRIDIAKLQ